MSSIKIDGLDKVQERLGRFIVNLPDATFDVLQELATEIVGDARAYAPIRTGYLRGNIRIVSVEKGRMTVVVESSAPYSGFVEFGTSKMPPKPFIQPAVSNARKTTVQRMKKKLEDITK